MEGVPNGGLSGGQSPGGPGGGFSRGPAPDHVKLFVGSVPKTAVEDDLRPHFEEHGNVLDVFIIKNRQSGQSAGCAFVKYPTIEEAERAIKGLHNNVTLPGATGPLQVRYADGERDRIGAIEHKLFVGNMGREVEEAEVEKAFSRFGEIEDIYIMRDETKSSRGCCFVKFKERESGLDAIRELNGMLVMKGMESPITVRWAEPKRPRMGDRDGRDFGGPGFRPRDGPRGLPGPFGPGRGWGGPLMGGPGMGPATGGPGMGHGPRVPPYGGGPGGGGPPYGGGAPRGGPPGAPMGGGSHNYYPPPQQQQPPPQQQSYYQPPPIQQQQPPPQQQQQQQQQPPPQQDYAPPQQYNPPPQQYMPPPQQFTPPPQQQYNPPPQQQQYTPPPQQQYAPPPQQQQYSSPPPAAAPPATCDWTEHTAPQGYKYYYNAKTGVSTWEKPKELADFEQQQQQQQQPPLAQAAAPSAPLQATPDQAPQYAGAPQDYGPPQWQQPQQQQPQQQQQQAPLQQQPVAGGFGGGGGGYGAQPAAAGAQDGGAQRTQGPPGANLFVFRVPDDYDDTVLRELFAPYGNVIHSHVGTDRETGRTKGFGFVSFDSVAAADAAIAALNGHSVGGRRLKVEKKRGEDDGFSGGYRPY